MAGNCARVPSVATNARPGLFCKAWKRLSSWARVLRRPKTRSESSCMRRSTVSPGAKPLIQQLLLMLIPGSRGEEQTVTEGSIKRYRQVLADFVAFLGARQHARLEALSKDVFLGYRAKLQADGHSPRNINQI